MTQHGLRKWFAATGWYIILICIALITAIPFVWAGLMSVRENSGNIFSALKPPQLIPYPGLIGWGDGADEAQETGGFKVTGDAVNEENPWGWWHDYGPFYEGKLADSGIQQYTFAATTENYYDVWDQIKLPRYFRNSLIVGISSVILNLLTCSMAAYPLAKMRFKGRDTLFTLLLSTMVFPPQLLMIPLYVMAVKVYGFQNTYWALILPVGTSAFGIFLLRQIYMGIPDELLEAARLDGATELGIWWRVLLPLIKPGLATLAIITFINSWNDFLWPLLMMRDPEMMTLPVGLSYLRGVFSGSLRTVAAGIMFATVPMIVFFLAFQRQFIRGLAGAVKG
jgi:putative chitobiose transport system permease protein